MKRLRGFTLIELMVAVGIIGILAATAISNFRLFSLRAKKAERDVMVNALVKACQDYLVRNDFSVAGGTLTANWQPPLPPTTTRQKMDLTVAGWSTLAGSFQNYGNPYHSYYVFIQTTPTPIYFLIQAEGDIDGDGVLNVKTQQWNLTHGSWQMVTNTETGGQF